MLNNDYVFRAAGTVFRSACAIGRVFLIVSRERGNNSALGLREENRVENGARDRFREMIRIGILLDLPTREEVRPLYSRELAEKERSRL